MAEHVPLKSAVTGALRLPAANDTSSPKVIEDYLGVKQIKNRATNNYMAIEHVQDYVESIAIQDTWESARWTLENAPTAGYTIIRSVWHNTEILNVENLRGYAQHATSPQAGIARSG